MTSAKYDNMNRCVVAWTGGIDSTALVASLLARNFHVLTVTLGIYVSRQQVLHGREQEACQLLLPHLQKIAGEANVTLISTQHAANWIWAFSSSHDDEIPHRNKRIMDWLIVRVLQPAGIFNLGMGEYVGCDTWLVRDHVAALDADARHLGSYLLHEYGLDYRLITLADFGESRFKYQRLLIGAGILGPAVMALTTNCLRNKTMHCGCCYKCVERRAAFLSAGLEDQTTYLTPPCAALVETYRAQMRGQDITVPYSTFRG